MTLFKILLVGAAIIVLMGVARNQQWAQRVGVVGGCVATQPPRSEPGGAWYVCKQGVMTGFPNLEIDSCSSAGIVSHQEVWRCDAALVSLPGY